MSKELRYLVFEAEYYRNHHGLTGTELVDLFSQHGIYQLILDNYYLYRIESPDHMVADIDNYIATGSVLGAWLTCHSESVPVLASLLGVAMPVGADIEGRGLGAVHEGARVDRNALVDPGRVDQEVDFLGGFDCLEAPHERVMRPIVGVLGKRRGNIRIEVQITPGKQAVDID